MAAIDGQTTVCLVLTRALRPRLEGSALGAFRKYQSESSYLYLWRVDGDT